MNEELKTNHNIRIVTLATSERVLCMFGNITDDTEEKKYSHKGISHKNFSRNWQLADDVEVESVDFKDGLLTITLMKELPEKQKRQKHF